MREDMINLQELKVSKELFGIMAIGYMFKELEERNRLSWMDDMFENKDELKVGSKYDDIKKACNTLINAHTDRNDEISNYISLSANKLLTLITLYEQGKVI